MIQISRQDNGPARLQFSGERLTLLDCAAYDASPHDYKSGEARFPQREYSAKKEVKDLLIKIHHSKCCYCEKKLWSLAYLHIEHFRPTRGVRQALDQRNDELPGYYWLAYRWENLLLSCHDCNSIYKKTYFPLANPTERARSHHDDVTRERPLLVDPVRQDPRDHIRFYDDLPTGITEQGSVTIKVIGLRRDALRQNRLSLLRLIDTFYAILQLPAEQPGNPQLQAMARTFIESAMQPDAKFSSMVSDYVVRLGL